MSGVRRPPRAYHPDRVRDALLAQVEFVRLAAHELTGEHLARPAGPHGWDVRRLLAHLAGQIDALPRLLAEPAPLATKAETDLTVWALSTSRGTDLEAETLREVAAGDEVAAVDTAAEGMEPVLETGVREDVLLPHRLGAMRALDFTVTRIVELIVYSDDLARATHRLVRLDRQALAITVRVLADALAVKAPGGSMELRVPPFVAVQCLPGPRHTRGTPANVVETDPVTWVRLAAGRTTWEAVVATGRLRASGERTRALAKELPVLG